VKDALIKLRIEGCARSMEVINDAAAKDARIKCTKVECALGMGHNTRRNYAAVKDAQIMSSTEECAEGTGQRRNYAALKDAQIKPSEEECV